ncbi:MAG TPA: hypothetical protein VFV86_01850 [Nitrososphaeraceae archaeon]|nr:hypothetical protein [Nitrososphaeraceae archaeon]
MEKSGEDNLNLERFPITKEETEFLNKTHRGHECHIEAIEKIE